MRRIERTGRFKRDYKRELKGAHGATLESNLSEIVSTLANNQPLAERYCDHPLSGEWQDHRDCHIKPDRVLIYRKPDPERLQRVRLGSHAALGL